MPEYFDISLIGHRTNEQTRVCLDKFGLYEGETINSHFGNRKVFVSYIENEKTDFEEICISFPEQIFHKETLVDELKQFTVFINQCFACNPNLLYALCSYELNGYLLSSITQLQQIDSKILSKFPIVYKKGNKLTQPDVLINLDAQDIW